MYSSVTWSTVILVVVSSSAIAQSGRAGVQTVEPVFLRAQQMVTAGQDAAGRAVVDSVLAATADGTPRYAEALFWRATLSKTAAGAERDYRHIAVEYPLSPRAQDALFRLAQLEMTRGDRASARAHLERIQREHPSGPTSTRASAKLAELAFGDGDIIAGCAAVAAAREGLTASDVELRNQLDYFGPRCANIAALNAARDSSTARAASNASASATAQADTRQEYSVQVAAYGTRAGADSLTKRLSSRGYTVRVVGERPPYRVRVGRYSTRERAADAVRQMARLNVHGVIVEAEPR